MLRAVLLDDERPSLNILNKLVRERSDVQVVGAYTDPSEMLRDAKELGPDIVFLDIEMPGMNGLEIASRILELLEDVEIVFITAYHQYALEAFRVHALDYLLKPVEPELLYRTIDRVVKRKKGNVAAVSESGQAPSRIVCLGGFEVYPAEQTEPIRFPTAKAEELFAYLLVHRNTNISKWTLCDCLWPGIISSEKLNQNLHMAVYRMKKTLRDGGIGVRISSQRGFYRMECDAPCDYVMFEQAAVDMNELNPRHVEVATKAIQLYRGPLFGSRDYPWCEAERERMSRYYAGLAKRVARWHFDQGHYHETIELLLSVLYDVPFDEEAHEILLRAYIGLQDRTAFLLHYERMKANFIEELGVEPPATLKQLYINMRLY